MNINALQKHSILMMYNEAPIYIRFQGKDGTVKEYVLKTPKDGNKLLLNKKD